MTVEFEPIFLKPLYEGDVFAAFPEVDEATMTKAFWYWAREFYGSMRWFYRSQLRQHQELVMREFKKLHTTVDEEFLYYSSEYADYCNNAMLTVHTDRFDRKMKELEFFMRGEGSVVSFNEAAREYIASLQPIATGRLSPIVYSRLIDEVWFNYISGNNPVDWQREWKTMPYDDYLRTTHWRQVRAAAIIVHHCRCQSRRCQGSDDYWLEMSTLQVHHVSYKNRGREQYRDVKLLCQDCHQLLHERGESYIGGFVES